MTRFLRSILCYGVWLSGLALTTVHLSGYAQTIPPTTRLPGGLGSDLERLFGGKRPTVAAGEVIFEGTIDPDEYVVGPGDRLNIVFWQPTYQEQECLVNGEGDVVIPLVGVQTVGGLTMTEARAQLEAAVARTLRIGRITVSLVEPRKFRVHVTGMVAQPGSYTVPATARVADAIELAGGLSRVPGFAAGDTASKVTASQRQIELWNRDGSSAGHADLLLFRRGGLVKANPFLRDGQTIHARHPSGSFDQVGVFGAVHESGLFEFVDGDCVADLIALGGGLAANADSSSVNVVRANGERLVADLRRGGAGMILQSGDRVYVGGFPDTSRAGSVVIRGEVARPGGYPIISGETTLREVLQAAGGLLPSAAANSARLIRNRPYDPVERERMRVLRAESVPNMQPAFKPDPELAAEFSRWDYGTVVLDLTGAREKGADGELRLQDGDVLEVPRSPLGVRVLGAVNHAGEVDWEAGRGLSYYLEQAGGVNRVGWKSRTVILKARNGSQLQYQSSLPIDPGDVIFVPVKQQMTAWEMVKDFVSVTAQVATVALIVQNIGKK